MICENCENEHAGSYGSGRFCSAKCARGFSTRNKRQEINEKVSASLKGRTTHSMEVMHNPEARMKAREGLRAFHRRNRLTISDEGNEVPVGTEILKASARRSLLFEEQKGACNRCTNTHWMGEPITLEIEHIDGNNRNNRRENLELLCPNCHSYTKTWRGRNIKTSVMVSDDQLLHAICAHGSIHKALIDIGMSPKGRNYERCKRVMREKGVALISTRNRMTYEDVRIAASLRASGMSYQEIAWALGFCRSTISERLKGWNLELLVAGITP